MEKLKDWNVLEKDIIELCKKHSITAASFTGTFQDGVGVSFFSVDSPIIDGKIFDAAMNVGRLWQHVRSQIKAGLDNFEKWR